MKRGSIFSITIVLCIIMLVLPIEAATSNQIYAGKQLATLQLLKGYEDGSLGLDQNIKRVEMAVLLVRILGYDNSIVIGAENQKFQDLSDSYWGKPWIQKATQLQLIKGYPGGVFQPENNISYVETVALMVRMLKKESNLTGEWPMNYMNRGKEIGIIPSTIHKQPDELLTRGEVAEIVWNTLLAKIK